MSEMDTTVNDADELTGLEVAIVGMAVNLPGSEDVGAYWQNLMDKVDTVRWFSLEELEKEGADPIMIRSPNYVRAGQLIDGIDLFDAAFFGSSPREAELMDPQQRKFLEVCWHALEDAGYTPEGYDGLIGIYAGQKMSSYIYHLFSDPEVMATTGELPLLTSNDKDYIATRVAYKLNLGGPAVSVQTACSTSLVALHMACQALLSGECDMALAGGVAIRVEQTGYMFQEGQIFSPDGHVRAFDKDARGTVFGNGLGTVVVKRLEDAIDDGDHIYAVVKGTAVTNDGNQKVGFTAPGADGQERVVRAAQMTAEVDPSTITYVECHGTGTEIGDPIEVGALSRVFREHTDEKNYCVLGSVKTNIGHLNAAAGVASLAKAAMALQKRTIPATLHFNEPNPQLDLDNSPFFVNTDTIEYPVAEGSPRRASVSSFGIGGTNAHAILEEAPEREAVSPSRPDQLLVLSARTEAALDASAARLAAYLRDNTDTPLADVAYTLQRGRRLHENRRYLVAKDAADAAAVLEGDEPKRLLGGYSPEKERQVVFMFSGQGAQHAGMGAGLYRTEKVFRDAVDHASEVLEPLLGFDLRTVLFPAEGEHESAQAKLAETNVTQPALFTIEHALAKLWMSWGVTPQAMIGHSIGEYVAACLSGVFSVDDALKLVAARGRLMHGLPAGTMLSVPLGEDEVKPYLGPQLSLAALNAPGRSVVSGPTDAIEALQTTLNEAGVRARPLQTSHAFHSPMMEPILPAFVQAFDGITLSAPETPFVSNVTGTWITEAEATDPAYWARHLRQAVRFADGVGTLLQEGEPLLLEVGPGNTLVSLSRRHPARKPEVTVAASLPHAKEAPGSDAAFALSTLGQLWMAGVPIDWTGFYADERRQRRPLPLYPFQGTRFWVDRKPFEDQASLASRKKPDLADWFYVPSWKPSVPPVADAEVGKWVVFADDRGVAEQAVGALREQGAEVLVVQAGDGFAAHDDGQGFTLGPADRDGYDSLVAALHDQDHVPEAVLHLWGLTDDSQASQGDAAAAKAAEDRGFWSLLFLAQALGKKGLKSPLRLVVATDRMRRLAGDAFGAELACPEKASVLGPCKVIPQEYSHVTCTAIDLALPGDADDAERTEMVEQLLAEVRGQQESAVVAYRDGERFVHGYEPVPFDKVNGDRLPLRDGGVYLITGGLGGFGLTFAKDLAESCNAKLVLTGRSGLPARDTWDAYLAEQGADENDKTAAQIRKVQALEAMGAEVMVCAVDVTDEAGMRGVVEQAKAAFGTVDGVIHAAGIAGGGVIQLKTPNVASAVIDPKVQGTIALDRALRGVLGSDEPDFVMLCSSTIAVLGGFGQVDYCAGNSFMDAYAEARNRRRGTYWVSINWSGWQEVGMAVDAAARGGRVTPSTPVVNDTPSIHPLLDRTEPGDTGQTVYATDFSTARHWLLDEHRIAGKGGVPGTTYLELARAAYAHATGAEHVEVKEVFFLTPLMVAEGASRECRVILEGDGPVRRFKVVSRVAEGSDQWQDHAMGAVGPLAVTERRSFDVEDILGRCQVSTVEIGEDDRLGQAEGQLVTWGDRWQCLKSIHLGTGEGIAALAMPEAFHDDFDGLGMHPAMLDVATALTNGLAEGGEYLPLSYHRVRVKAPLPPRFYSFLRVAEGSSVTGGETVTADITLIDAEGNELVDIERFTMKKVGAAASRLEGDRAGAADQEGAPVAAQAEAPVAAKADDKPANPAAQSTFNIAGMTPKEGVEALRRVLSRGRHAQVVVSPTDLMARIRKAKAADVGATAEPSAAKPAPARGSHPRPNIPTPYVAPTNELEEKLCDVWQRVLGIDKVGIHDNFFDLGGDSVMGIQVIAGAGEAGLTLAPEQLFEHQTVAELAALGGEAPAEDAPGELEAVAEGGVDSVDDDLADVDLSEDELESVMSQLGS